MTSLTTIFEDPTLTVRQRLFGLVRGPVGSIGATLVVTLIIGIIVVGPEFFSASNIQIVGVSVAIPLIVGVLASFALLAGVVDLSIGSMVGFGAVVFNQLVAIGWNPWLVALITVGVGIVVGLVNAFVIVRFNAEPLAVTLGMLTLLRGLSQVVVVSAPPSTLIDPLYDLTEGSVGGFPTLLLIGIGVTLIASGVVAKTRLGRKVQAVGGDPRAAARAGISVPKVRVIALVVSAVGASIGGILYVGQLGSASNVLGTGLEFQIYAALMIGGYSITRGGVGNPVGGLLGLLVVAGITNILNVTFIDPSYLDLIVALILLAAVLVDRFRGGGLVRMTDDSLNRLGNTGLHVAPFTVGTAAWGVESAVHGLAVPERNAVDTVLRAFDSRINIIDTSNNYGGGESERRIGVAIRERGGLPPGFVVQTKLDRDPVTGSFDSGRMRESFGQSLDRLGLDRVPLLFLHDPENISYDEAMADDGPVATLVALRDEGFTDHIGISGGPAKLLTRYVETGLFAALITHNRFTLVDRTANELITAAAETGVGVFNAAVYGGGMLANWPRTSDKYHYEAAPAHLLAAVDAMGAVCQAHGIPLIAAALQFSTRDPRIASTVAGVVSPQQFDETLKLLEMDIPDALWAELEDLTPPASGWIND